MLSALQRLGMVTAATSAVAGGLFLGGAPSALADYGGGAQYQVEVSENCNGLQDCAPAQGDGVWLWIELDAGGGDYQGTDCAHQVTTPTGTVSGAAHESGDVTWSVADGEIVIEGVRLLGGADAVTVRVPAAYGHYALPGPTVISPFGSGQAQVQVAP